MFGSDFHVTHVVFICHFLMKYFVSCELGWLICSRTFVSLNLNYNLSIR